MNLKLLLEHLLSEQIDEDMDEMANYPKGFDVFTLRKLNNSWDKKAYIEKYLKPLGEGSARAVFVADEQTALKVAISKAGQAQNKLEVQVYNKARNKSYTDLITNVFEYDENFLWIESERAGPIVYAEQWSKVAGVSFYDFMDALDAYDSSDEIGRLRDGKKIVKMPMFKQLIAMMKDYKMLISDGFHDFRNPTNWGIVKRNGKQHVVVVDYGLDKKVYNKYYK